MDHIAVVRASGRVRHRPKRLTTNKAYDEQRIQRWLCQYVQLRRIRGCAIVTLLSSIAKRKPLVARIS
jgi:hypothetical protein